MKIIFEKKILKDIECLDVNTSKKLKETILNIKLLENHLKIKNIKKLSWYKNYYRIRIWDYRLWLRIENNICCFIRIKHRKDIYNVFP